MIKLDCYNYRLCLICLLFVLAACSEQSLKVGLLVGSDARQQTSELAALSQLLQAEKGVTYEYVPMDQLDELGRFDVVWYHRPDSLPITEQEKKMGSVLTKYVSDGGKLMLSMEAVRLLNEWGIEPEAIETSAFDARDDGFGRKVGFHAYREHPLFDKMFGGAYTWHGKEDNQCRVLGFFGDKKPLAQNAKVIGTLWEYIYYHPKDKVLWETELGKGKILAIGGFLYYDKENFHTEILNQFTRNCLSYMAGRPGESKTFYWEDRPTEVVAEELALGKIEQTAPAVWSIPAAEDAISWKATNAGVDLPSKRTMLVAKERSGIEEIWTHPFMSLRDYRVWLDMAGSDTLVSLNSFDTTIELRANSIIRTYEGAGFTLKEVLTAPIDKPVTVAHYEWTGDAVRRIVTDYKSNLRFMWPYDEYALGSIYHHWSPQANAFIIRDVNKEFVSVVGANLPGKLLLAGRFDGFNYGKDKTPESIATDKLQVASSVAYDVAGQKSIDLFMVAGNEGVDKVMADYAQAAKAPQQIFNASADYYKNYLNENLSIVSPDTLFNEGFRWATLSSAQFIVETPGIGTSLMAGYSSSRRGWGGAHKVSGRPGYAWYFGRDAVWSAYAFAGLGDFATVRRVLETLIKYQQIDGKIYHELTTSGSVHFDASDATPMFVNLMARYLRASGDQEFVRNNMAAVTKAMDYCYSTDTDGDHLIEISNVGHGWLEGGDLYGSHTEFYLVGLWNAALNDAAYLAGVMGDKTNETKYNAEAKVVNEILNKDFWNEKGYYNYGKRQDGTFTDECIVLTSVPVLMGVTEPERSLQMMKLFSSGGYSADWGVRMIDDSHSVFNPSAYHFGSVWPLFTGWTALADYKVGRYNQGYSHMMSSLLNYAGATRGRVPEVINGMVYKSSGITTHQCWSETMVLQPGIEGMLGFVPDALNKQFMLAPRLPFHWNTLQVKNLRVGDTSIAFDMKKAAGKVVYTFTSDKPSNVSFSPTYPLGTQVSRVLVDGKEAQFSLPAEAEYVTVNVGTAVGKNTVIEVFLREGMAALPAYRLARNEEMSKGIHVLNQKWVDGVLEVIVEGRAGSTGSLELYLPNGYRKIEGGGQAISKPCGVYAVELDFPKKSSESYISKVIRVVQ